MPEQRDLFDLAAADAANIRTAAQAELAQDLAKEILRHPSQFDPNRLKVLGSDGLRALLAAVRRHAVDAAPRHGVLAEPVDRRTEVSSWEDLQKLEPDRWLRALAAGVASGLLIIVCGLVAAMFS
ncbi:hypothetical protein ACVWZ6_009174 [Bradyrhizobium sp. GM6.1]